MKFFRVIILILIGIMIVACTNQNVSNQELLPYSPVTAPMPQSGKATVIGQIISKKTGQPLINTIVRLPEVYREGEQVAFALDGAQSPGAITDQQGKFIMSDIEAREYVLMVGDVYGLYVVVPETDNSNKARIWNPLVDEILDLGRIYVDL